MCRKHKVAKASVNMKYTKEQTDAATRISSNILVSAGAGSGKTEVLSERVANHVLNGVPISKLVVLTFTNDAASEMKIRIQKKIRGYAKENLDNKNLQRAVNECLQARIQTFDSFTMDIVKKYYYLLNLSSDISIENKEYLGLLEKKIMEEIFRSYLVGDKKDPRFTELINYYCIRNYDSLVDAFINFDHSIQLFQNEDDFYDNYDAIFQSQDFYLKIEALWTKFLMNKGLEISGLFSSLLKTFPEFEYYLKSKNAREFQMNPLSDPSDNLSSLIAWAASIEFPSLTKKYKEGCEDTVDAFKEELKNFKNLKDEFLTLANKDFQLNLQILKDLRRIEPVIIEILKEFHGEILNYKLTNEQLDFMDIAKLAISLIKTHPNIQKEISDSIFEILIDEYQDTSDIQEELINALHAQHVYMVGDIKQSIYGFRNANPKLFQQKYNDYKQKKGGELIELNKNFRSSRCVIETINSIFNSIMTEEVGGANYKLEHQLSYGCTKFDDSDNDKKCKIVAYPKIEGFKALDKTVLEAEYIAKDIQNKINNKYKFLNKKAKKKVDANKKTEDEVYANYNDFVILVRSRSEYSIFSKVFDYLKIPLSLDSTNEVLNSMNIQVILNILKVCYSYIDKTFAIDSFKHALTSALRSFVIEASDETIYTLVNGKDVDEIMDDFKKTTIFKPFDTIISLISIYPMHMIVESLYQEFHIYEKILLLDDTNIVLNQLYYLKEEAYNLSRKDLTTKEILNYFDDLVSSKKDIICAPIESENNQSVRIITIHSSKGLQYRYCYFPLLWKSYNKTDTQKNFICSQSLGLIMPLRVNDSIQDTILKTLYIDSLDIENKSEEMRLFYVALTRAEEGFELIVEEKEKEKACDIRNCNSYEDLLRLAPCKEPNGYYDYVTMDWESVYDDSYYIGASKEELDFNEDCNQSELVIKNLVIPEETTSQVHASTAITSLITPSMQSQLDRGIYLHQILQFVSIKNYEVELLNYINKTNKDYAIIESFYTNNLIQGLDIIEEYHEYHFIYEDAGIEKSGIIDLLLHTKTGFVVIDFKTKELNHDEYVNQLKVYRDFCKKNLTKQKETVETYLYSILDKVFLKINE